MGMNVQPAFQTATPFDSVAESYDELFTESFVGRAQRRVVWREMDRLFRPGQRILEINSGTGVDAVRLAQRGVRVVGCDASSVMTHVASRRALQMGLASRLEFHTASTEEIYRLSGEPPFDGLLSNFAGLNCVRNLDAVVPALAQLLRPGANVLLCVFGKYCAWELFWNLAHGNRRRAFRRLRKAFGGDVAGQRLQVDYWSVRHLRRCFSRCFRFKRQAGVGIAVPPSYLEFLTSRCPGIFGAAAKLDLGLSGFPIFCSLADHALLTFERL
ncbi:MAG: class I SAM-dependent methyltransferase [Terriglobia bacterium]